MDLWYERFIRNGCHPIPSRISDQRRTPTLQVLYWLWQAYNRYSGLQMGPRKWIKDSGCPSGLSKSKWTSRKDVDKSPVNDSLLTHRLTNNQGYWYYAIYHYTRILNVCPVKLSCQLITPHELVNGVKPYSRSWFTIFSVGHFYHQKDGAVTRS